MTTTITMMLNSAINMITKQESCAIAKMTAQCALYTGALKIYIAALALALVMTLTETVYLS